MQELPGALELLFNLSPFNPSHTQKRPSDTVLTIHLLDPDAEEQAPCLRVSMTVGPHAITYVSEDVIFLVTRNIPNRADLRSLSICSQSCRGPAQKELFRTITRRIKMTNWRLEVLPFLEDHPTLASYIQHFTLQNDRFIIPKPGLDIIDIQNLVKGLTAVVSVSLISFDWFPSVAGLDTSQTHKLLRRLALLGLTAYHPVASPLEILALANEWDEVELETISHPMFTVPPTCRPLSTYVLNIFHYPLSTSRTLPPNVDIFQHVVRLTTRYVTSMHLEPIANTLKRSHGTLQSLVLRAVRFETFEHIEDWANLLMQLRFCTNLVKLELHFSLSQSQPMPDDSPVPHDSLQALLARGLARSVRASIRCIDIVLDIHGPTQQKAIDQFLTLGWSAIGGELARAKNLEVVRVGIRSFHEDILRWHAAQYQAVKAAFPQLAFHHGNAYTSLFLACKSRESLPRAISLLHYSPKVPGDACP
ncbi:hypothetical protein NM688_g6368 [Phlebia brevispora]|uniref:Uncharacterized protein n=1 Tax=Phlebia brevispora TaxID=194682 RepID=A0ACC1SGP5_9APHY|nr:hypothetical protein NM688_g6368 [Phlebia brevispora]